MASENDVLLVPIEQIERLNRLGDWNATELAQELYTIFSATVLVNNEPAASPGRFKSPTPAVLVNLPSMPAPAGSLPTAFPIAAWGIVQSQVGTVGNIYLVDVYLANPASSPAIGRFQAVQRQIDAETSIPPGTETPVTCFAETTNGGANLVITSVVMQIPIYLGRP